MKAFVTGANGFIGSHLVRTLLRRGDSVRGLVRKGGDHRNIRDLEFERVSGDIHDPEALNGLMEGCDVFFNLSGFVQFWAKDKGIFSDIHVNGLDPMLVEARRAGVGRIVQVSSVVAVGASPTRTPIDEGAEWNLEPLGDPYALTKRAGEVLFLERIKEWGMDGVVVNPGAVIGPGDIHLSHAGRAVRDYAAGSIPCYVNSGFNAIAVEDVVDGMIAAALRGRNGERYLLTHENIHYGDFFGMIDSILGRPKRSRPIPHWLAVGAAAVLHAATVFTRRPPIATLPAARLARFNFFYDNRKAREELGLSFRPIRSALEAELNWFAREGFLDAPVPKADPRVSLESH